MAKDEDLGVYIYEGEGGEVVVPEGYTAIGMHAFAHSSVTSVTIPKSVKVIGVKAFMGCQQLVRLVIESPDVTIKSLAFLGCDNLCELILPEHFKAIDVFAHRDRFAYYRFYPTAERAAFHVLYWLRDGMPKNTPSAILRKFIKERYPLLLRTIAEEGSVEDFEGFVTSETVPNISVDSLDEMMQLTSSLDLRTAILAYKERRFSAEMLQLIEEDKTAKAFGEKEYELSDFQRLFTVTEEEGGYFLGNYMGIEKNLFLPDTISGKPIVGIKKRTFVDCSFLESVRLPATLKSIGEYAFADCGGLHFLDLPDSLSVIEEGAFSHCTELLSVTMGRGVKHVEKNAFLKCEQLATFRFEGVFADWLKVEDDACMLFAYAKEIFFEGEKLSADILLPEGTKEVARNLFYGYGGLRSVTLPESVRKICVGAFERCNGLTTVTLGSAIRRIESFAFSRCPDLERVFFQGTRSQWTKVAKPRDWFGRGPESKVRCIDD